MDSELLLYLNEIKYRIDELKEIYKDYAQVDLKKFDSDFSELKKQSLELCKISKQFGDYINKNVYRDRRRFYLLFGSNTVIILLLLSMRKR